MGVGELHIPQYDGTLNLFLSLSLSLRLEVGGV
jgi:hypothetical protein